MKRRFLSYFGIGTKYPYMWDKHEDICKVHKKPMKYLGYYHERSANIYECELCEAEWNIKYSTQEALEERKKMSSLTDLSKALKQYYE